MKKRTDFPFTGAGSAQWRAYQKKHGLGAYAGGGERKAGLKPADETVIETQASAKEMARIRRYNPDVSQAELRRMAGQRQRVVKSKREAQRRALRKKGKKD